MDNMFEHLERFYRDEAYKSRTVSDVCPETLVYPKEEGKRRGLIIGVSRFDSEKIRPLDGVESDVELLRERLLDPHCGFESVDVLTRDSYVVPKGVNILNKLKEFCETCRPNDKSVVGLIGHGFYDTVTEEDYFVPFDAEPIVDEYDRVVSYRASTCISFGQLREIYRVHPVAFNWTIVDACRVNMRTRDSFGEKNVWTPIRKLEADNGSFWSQSCSVGEESIEKPFADGRTRGVFIWYLCEGLSGKADVKDGLITPFDVQNYACAQMKKDKSHSKQTPQSSGTNLSSASEFVIADFSDAKEVRVKKMIKDALQFLGDGNYERAAATIDEAAKLAPENKEVKNLAKLIEDKGKSTTEPPKINGDLELAKMHAQAGRDAYEGKDFTLALKNAETALTFDPACEDAKNLEEEAQEELDKLARLLQQGNDLYKAKQYEDAVKKANEIKSLCANYPEADFLEKKAKTSWFGKLVADGEARLKRGDGAAARDAARSALQLIPDGPQALKLKAVELEKKALDLIADDLVALAKDELERDEYDSAQDNLRQALQLVPEHSGAKNLEAKAKRRKSVELILDGWEAYGDADGTNALQKGEEALKIDPNSERAKKLLETARKLSSAVWNGTRAGERREIEIKGRKYGLCWIPPGKFTMGSPESEKDRSNDETQHEVRLTKGFWMLETPVTQGLWSSVMGSNPSWFCATGGGSSKVQGMDTTNFPVEGVSWHDCQEFLKKLNNLLDMPFKLPTEAQWEYACRAGKYTPYHFGSSLNGDKANCDGNNPYGTSTKGAYLVRTCAVKSYEPNDWGLYDMHGNCWEWCADWYGDYPKGSAVDPIGSTSASSRVIRGGCWSYYARFCRSARRYSFAPAPRNYDVGFRLVSE